MSGSQKTCLLANNSGCAASMSLARVPEQLQPRLPADVQRVAQAQGFLPLTADTVLPTVGNIFNFPTVHSLNGCHGLNYKKSAARSLESQAGLLRGDRVYWGRFHYLTYVN